MPETRFGPDETLVLPPYGTLPEIAHVLAGKSRAAIRAAVHAGRPLLVRGEPGTGKSQLARAAAVLLGRAFVPFVIDARTEARDLLYSLDSVARLAEAQLVPFLAKETTAEKARTSLEKKKFTTPGPLWWAFNWQSAVDQAADGKAAVPWTPPGWTPADGVVLLIDEIDKADPGVPNGLLEALGLGRFPTPWGEEVVSAAEGQARPLVVITTNEERALPDAFVRRCLVLSLAWPSEREALVSDLVKWGRAHFPEAGGRLLREAAALVAADRARAGDRGVCPPGGAEYLDLLRAVTGEWPNDEPKQLEALVLVQEFALRKHPEVIAE